jgi:DNA-binding SARP family transcriptional activator/tetratricopeptide (TPR) repeat protein
VSGAARSLLEIRLLGPVEILVAGRPLPLGPPKQRAVLAALLIDAGRPVSVPTLIDRVWGIDATPKTRASLYGHIARIRSLLAEAGTPAGRIRIDRGSGFYRLSVDPELIDSCRVRDLVSRAREAADRAEGQIGLLREALGLWRGEALEGLSGEWAEQVRNEFAALRLDALANWAEIELELGNHGVVLEQVGGVVLRHPLAEPLIALHLRALLLDGRGAEALSRYEATRRRLAEDLGTEPGSELQEIYQALLHGGSHVARGPSTVGRVTADRPNQLPSDGSVFVGRRAELLDLHNHLMTSPQGDSSGRMAAIAGPPGVGKSTLAIRVAHRSSEYFTDGQLYVDLQGATAGLAPLEPIAVLDRFLRSLGIDGASIPSDVTAAAELFHTTVAGRRVLVVLDNARDEDQVRPFLPAAPRTGVLVTGRRPLDLAGAARFQLEPLHRVEAMELLRRLLGPARMASDPAAAAEVARWCGFVPLALNIAAARLVARPAWPVAALAQRLADERRRLDELEIAAEAGMRASFAVSVEQLRTSPDPTDRAAADAYPRIGLWNVPDVGVEVTALLLDRPIEDAERALERLVDARLLETTAPGRYRLHDLLRLYARERAEVACPAPVGMSALERATGWYTASCWRTLALLRPGNDRLSRTCRRWTAGGREFADATEALAWLEIETDSILALVRLAARTDGFGGAAVQLAQALFGFLPLRGYMRDWEWVNRIALDVAARIGDRAAEAQAENDLAGALSSLGRHADAAAHLERSLATFRDLGDRLGEASITGNLGVVYLGLGRLDDAETSLKESLTLYQELGDRRGEASCALNLGQVVAEQGRLAEGVAWLERALPMYRELGDQVGTARCLNALGLCYRLQHRYADARRAGEEALCINRTLENNFNQAYNLAMLADVDYRERRYDDALDHCLSALATFQKSGSRPEEAACLHQLGLIQRARGDLESARAYWSEALQIYDGLGLPAAAQVRSDLAGLPPPASATVAG